MRYGISSISNLCTEEGNFDRAVAEIDPSLDFTELILNSFMAEHLKHGFSFLLQSLFYVEVSFAG